MPNNISFAEVPGLKREMRRHFTLDMVRRIAEAGANGRILAVSTTNLDDGTARVFDLVAETQRAINSGQVDRIHNIMLASARIPGASPFRMIDREIYVDGGVTGNIVYGGRKAERSLPALWQRRYPTLPIPPLRSWVIFNNQFRPVPKCVAKLARGHSAEPGDRRAAATATAMRHLFAMAEIYRLKRKGDVEVPRRLDPQRMVPPVPGVFIKESMNDLADLGEKMGADPRVGAMCPRCFEPAGPIQPHG